MSCNGDQHVQTFGLVCWLLGWGLFRRDFNFQWQEASRRRQQRAVFGKGSGKKLGRGEQVKPPTMLSRIQGIPSMPRVQLAFWLFLLVFAVLWTVVLTRQSDDKLYSDYQQLYRRLG